uniref:Uncharacterized protein n=1 Tax=Anopheles farauti TaxID=69004 RepID=A0A182QP36_9DIPT
MEHGDSGTMDTRTAQRKPQRDQPTIQDSSLGGSSDDEDLLGVLRGPSSFANAFLYTKQPQIYPKSIVKTKTYEGVEALRQIATTSLFLQNEQKVSSNRIVPIIKEPEKLEEPPLELKKIDGARRDEAAIVSISDGEDADSHRRQAGALAASDTQVIDLTGEDLDDEHSQSPTSGTTSHHQRKYSKLRRQRTSVHQQKPGRELQSSAYGTSTSSSSATAPPTEPNSNLLMETSLMIIGPTPLSSPTKSHGTVTTTAIPATSTSTLTVPMTGNGSVAKAGGAPIAGTSSSAGNLLTLPPAGTSGGPTVCFAGSTPLPGQLSPLPSTSYLGTSSVAAGGYRSSATSSSPLPGFLAGSVSPHYHSNSSSSSSNYIFSPPPFTQHEPITLGTNTSTTATASALAHTPAPSVAATAKTEPELVLSPAKLGQ